MGPFGRLCPRGAASAPGRSFSTSDRRPEYLLEELLASSGLRGTSVHGCLASLSVHHVENCLFLAGEHWGTAPREAML